MSEIKEGDKVQLKSGGQVMTVDGISGNVAQCVWFDGNTSKREKFNLVILEKYKEEV